MCEGPECKIPSWQLVKGSLSPFLPPQIYYKAVRDIEAGEELLVYMKDGIFPEGSMAPNLQGKINARH